MRELLRGVRRNIVMPGLEPGIHVFLPTASDKVVDGRDEPGHDGLNSHDEPNYSAASAAPSTIRTRSLMIRFNSKSFGV